MEQVWHVIPHIEALKNFLPWKWPSFSRASLRSIDLRSKRSDPVFWTRFVIFEALPWPNRWFNQQRVVIWLWVDALGYNISKNQLPRSKTVASSHKKVHFWNPIWRTPSALWNGPSPVSLSFLISRWWWDEIWCAKAPWVALDLYRISSSSAKNWLRYSTLLFTI